MTPAKDILRLFEDKSRELLSLNLINKRSLLCQIIPDLESIDYDNLESADVLLARIRSKSNSKMQHKADLIQ